MDQLSNNKVRAPLIVCDMQGSLLHSSTFFNPFSSSQFISFKFSLHFPHKLSCLVMRIKQLIIHSNLSKMKKNLSRPDYKETMETVWARIQQCVIYSVFGAKRVKTLTTHIGYKRCAVLKFKRPYFLCLTW